VQPVRYSGACPTFFLSDRKNTHPIDQHLPYIRGNSGLFVRSGMYQSRYPNRCKNASESLTVLQIMAVVPARRHDVVTAMHEST
jgi:hypothetical protein